MALSLPAGTYDPHQGPPPPLAIHDVVQGEPQQVPAEPGVARLCRCHTRPGEALAALRLPRRAPWEAGELHFDEGGVPSRRALTHANALPTPDYGAEPLQDAQRLVNDARLGRDPGAFGEHEELS